MKVGWWKCFGVSKSMWVCIKIYTCTGITLRNCWKSEYHLPKIYLSYTYNIRFDECWINKMRQFLFKNDFSFDGKDSRWCSTTPNKTDSEAKKNFFMKKKLKITQIGLKQIGLKTVKKPTLVSSKFGNTIKL